MCRKTIGGKYVELLVHYLHITLQIQNKTVCHCIVHYAQQHLISAIIDSSFIIAIMNLGKFKRDYRVDNLAACLLLDAFYFGFIT